MVVDISLSKVTGRNIGSKASNLQKMSEAGFNIPKGYVLTFDFLEYLLRENNRYYDFINLCRQEKIINRSKKIKNLITGLSYPKDTEKELFSVLDELNHIIVRSSSDNEDNIDCSMAGMYLSIGNITDLDGLKEAILGCYASAFTDAVLLLSGNFDFNMTVIIQQYMMADFSGIAFSVDPVNEDNNVIRINYDRNVSLLTDGNNTGYTLLYDRKEEKVITSGNKSDFDYNSLINLIIDAEKFFGYPVDVEWLCNKDGFYILQSRPVTSIKDSSKQQSLINLDDTEAIKSFAPGRLSTAHDKWFSKKYFIRKSCKLYNIPVYKAFYLLLDSDEKKRREVYGRIINELNCELVEFFDGKKYAIKKLSELVEFSEEIYRNLGEGYVRICEYWPAEFCGYASVTDEGDILIESVKGSFYGMWVGGLSPSTYVIDSYGTVISSSEKEQDFWFRMSPKTFEYEKYVSEEKICHRLSEKDISLIADICRTLTGEFGRVHIEWMGTKEGIRLFDLSEGTQLSGQSSYMADVLSRGNALAKPLILDDISELHNLFEDPVNDIDVIPTENFRRTLNSEKCLKTVEKILKGHEKPVIIYDFPDRTLAVLKDYVSGFVFRRGAQLCHLSIILREAGIPAVVYENIDAELSSCQNIHIQGGVLSFERVKEKMGREIIIEGTCCTGKSTIIKTLQSLNDYRVIDENIVIKDFSNRKIESEEAALERDCYFLGMDIDKWEKIKETKKYGDVILERCSLGTLSITYGSDKYSANLPYLVKLLEEALMKNEVPVPDAFIYLIPDEKIINERMLSDKNSKRVEHWNTVLSFYKQNEFLEAFFDYQTTVPVLRLCNKDSYNSAIQIDSFIKKLPENDHPDKIKFTDELLSFLKKYSK